MDVLVHNGMQTAANQKIDRRLVVDSLWQNPAALRSDPALTTNRHPVARSNVAANLNRDDEARSHLLGAVAVHACVAVSL